MKELLGFKRFVKTNRMKRYALLALIHFATFSALFAQITPIDSPYFQEGSYQVIAESDNTVNPTVFTFRPDAQVGETFPVFSFSLEPMALVQV